MSVKGMCINPILYVSDQLKLLSGVTLSYRYSVSLVDLRTGRVIDSNSGRLYRSGNEFVDSNKEFYTAITDRYFCKLDRSRKVVSIYQLDVLKRKLGIDPGIPRNTINIMDSLGFKSPVPQIDTSAREYYSLTWQLASPVQSSFCIWIDKKSYRLLSVRIAALEYIDEKHRYNRLCTISDISATPAGEPVDLRSIFRIEARKVVMASKYADYTVKSIID